MRVVEIDLVFVCGPKMAWLCVASKLTWFLVWVIEIDLMSVWKIEIDLISVLRSKLA